MGSNVTATLLVTKQYFTLRISVFLDFVHRPVFYKLENTTFRQLDLFPSSGEGLRKTFSLLGLLETTNLNHWKQIRNVVFHSC
jgi:hypothetical protein